MKLVGPNPATVKVLTIILALLFVIFALLFFGHALQKLRKEPVQAMQDAFLGLLNLLAGLFSTYILFT